MVEGSLGLKDEPLSEFFGGVDGAGPASIDEMFGADLTVYTEKLRLETPEGECIITADDGTVVLEYAKDNDD